MRNSQLNGRNCLRGKSDQYEATRISTLPLCKKYVRKVFFWKYLVESTLFLQEKIVRMHFPLQTLIGTLPSIVIKIPRSQKRLYGITKVVLFLNFKACHIVQNSTKYMFSNM